MGRMWRCRHGALHEDRRRRHRCSSVGTDCRCPSFGDCWRSACQIAALAILRDHSRVVAKKRVVEAPGRPPTHPTRRIHASLQRLTGRYRRQVMVADQSGDWRASTARGELRSDGLSLGCHGAFARGMSGVHVCLRAIDTVILVIYGPFSFFVGLWPLRRER